MTIHFADSTSIASGTGLGGLVQVKQTFKTDHYSAKQTSFTDITGMSVTITPTSSSNKILLLCTINWSSSSNSYHGYRFMRGSTAIGLSTALSDGSTIASFAGGSSSQGQWVNKIITANQSFLDSPNTTSSTTYKIQHITWDETLHVNRPHDTGGARYTMAVTSSITAMEVKP